MDINVWTLIDVFVFSLSSSTIIAVSISCMLCQSVKKNVIVPLVNLSKNIIVARPVYLIGAIDATWNSFSTHI